MNTTQAENSLLALLCNDVNATRSHGTRFASFTYTNQNNETSRYNVMLGINLVTLYKHDLATLTAMQPNLDGITLIACNELIASINNSLTKGIGNNDNYTLKGYYEDVTDNGEVKFHVDDTTGEKFLYIRGYVIKKTVLLKGEYKTVKSSEKTLAKNALDKQLKRGKIRTFKINVAQLHQIKSNGLTLEIS